MEYSLLAIKKIHFDFDKKVPEGLVFGGVLTVDLQTYAYNENKAMHQIQIRWTYRLHIKQGGVQTNKVIMSFIVEQKCDVTYTDDDPRINEKLYEALNIKSFNDARSEYDKHSANTWVSQCPILDEGKEHVDKAEIQKLVQGMKKRYDS